MCVGNLNIIGSDNGLSPGRRQAIIWTNYGILLIRPLGTNFSENSIEILTFSFKKTRLILSSAKWRPFCLGLNVLKECGIPSPIGQCNARSQETRSKSLIPNGTRSSFIVVIGNDMWLIVCLWMFFFRENMSNSLIQYSWIVHLHLQHISYVLIRFIVIVLFQICSRMLISGGISRLWPIATIAK